MSLGKKNSKQGPPNGRKMIFNKEDIALLASSKTATFDKEGALFIQEKSEGFFKRTEITAERWCRLRGNLLFYYKSRESQSQPAGVIVLENVSVAVDTSSIDGTFGLLLTSGTGHQRIQLLRCYTEEERDSWKDALESASYSNMRSRIESLKHHISKRVEAEGLNKSCSVKDKSLIDPNLQPYLSCRLSCDSLPLDPWGNPLQIRLTIFIRNNDDEAWNEFTKTEYCQASCNPSFNVCATFYPHQGISDNTQVKISAQYLREKLTQTKINLGLVAFTNIAELRATDHLRLCLKSISQELTSAPDGFVTLRSTTNQEDKLSSIDPSRTVKDEQNQDKCLTEIGAEEPGLSRFDEMRHPYIGDLTSNQSVQNYCFPSRLGADIRVTELMFEPKIGFFFPKQLLSLWISEEKELVHELAGLGELREPWHSCQMSWLENHLNLINTYNTALENLDNYRGPYLKRSVLKTDPLYPFVPINLHLHRIWVENESMRRSGLHDIFSSASFTAGAGADNHRSQTHGGLIKMLKLLKSPQDNSSAWCSASDKLQLAEDTLSAVRKVRREVVDCMRLLMKLAKERSGDGMFPIVEEMLKKTKLICSIPDTVLVEEALLFLEENKITKRPEKDEFSESVSEFMQRNKLKIDIEAKHGCGPLQTPCTEFICKELRTPDTDQSGGGSGDVWRGYSVFTSGYHSVDRLSDIDEFEETYKVVEDQGCYAFVRSGSQSRQPATPIRTTTLGGSTADSLDNISVDTGDILCDDYSGDEENDVDEDSTPHIMSETSKTQSPISAGKEEERLSNEHQVVDDVEPDSSQEEDDDETKENFNQAKRETTISEEMALEIELESDKTNFAEDRIDLYEELLQADEITAKQLEDNKISEGSFQHTTDLDENCVDSREGDQEETKTDFGISLETDSSPHYRNGDEPEPIDLTFLNIEAAMMCLASKVRTICGKAHSPTLSNRTFRFKELDCKKKTRCCHKARPFSNCHESQLEADAEEEGFQIPDVPRPGATEEEIEDWAEEVRPSMRKLRQGMDSLLKTTRMMCSVFRLEQSPEAVKLTAEVKHRRDVCFSQALTSLVSALMSRLWCHPPDPVFLSVLTQIGPLVCFEGLLSMHGEDVTVYNDMIVAVEDLRAVEFTLVKVEKPKDHKNSSNDQIPLMPVVSGSRSNLKVMIPLPFWATQPQPLQYIKEHYRHHINNMKFNIIPVFFNIGIDGQAQMAERQGLNGPQEKNNSDNFKILVEYVRKFKQKNYFNHIRKITNNDEALIDDLMVILKKEVSSRKIRNVDVLNISSWICHKLSGIRFTSCRDGLAKTAMSITLEQTRILARDYDLKEAEFLKTLNLIRSVGLHGEKCMKNTNTNKFTMSSLELQNLPRKYRPPIGTFGSQ